MSEINYVHVCTNDVKCSCNWEGCSCECKVSIVSVNKTTNSIEHKCPKCRIAVQTETQTWSTTDTEIINNKFKV